MSQIDSLPNDEVLNQDLPMYQGKLRFLTIAAAIGVIIALVLAVWELHLGNHARALADLIFPASAPFLIYLLWRHRSYASLVLHIFAFSIFIQQSSVALYLFDIKQMIWIPTYPIVYFYLLGHKGWGWSLLLFIELWAIYLLYPLFGRSEVISLDAMNNFMAAYLMIALLSWMYSREILFYQYTISRRAHYDYLTGIYNRAAWLDRLNQEIAILKRNERLSLSVIMFDLDDYKQVNDVYGHHMGDKVLIDVTKLFSERIRRSDVIGRWGGEEFVIFLPNTDLSQAGVVAEELRAQLENHRQGQVSITASFGVTQFHDGETIEDMFQRVDGSLYRAKAAGKNRVIAA